jgi:hypothetical protein
VRTFVQATLDGYDVGHLRPAMPILTVVARELRKRMPALDADVRTALAGSMIFGWHVIGPVYLEALGRKRVNADQLDAAFRPTVEALFSPD